MKQMQEKLHKPLFFTALIRKKQKNIKKFSTQIKLKTSQCNVKKKQNKKNTPTERHTDTKHRCFFKEEDK